MKQHAGSMMPPNATNDFKMGMVVLIFFITCFLLLAVAYLWIQEIRDRRSMQIINEELRTTQEELKESNIAAMKALIMSEEARDPYTSGHSRRVTEYAVAIARKIGMGEVPAKHIEYAGYLHDIGKIGISDAILNKEGRLSDEEWQVIRKHPNTALEILNPLKFLPEEKVIIKYHHERYDGNGYPDGLKGENIPMGARIMAVADSFDAMNSRRPYREALSKDKIISELKTARGTQLDPAIVDVFLDIINSDSSIFEKE
ncbi:MAG: HD-GYP domain-containing protein [Candidatus Omnitrophica bacterium]|nr:HD-GYP domain-containing protein [Candidatus Omnitrophota bacterium]